MRISIIVPILDEAEQLPDLFAHLLPMKRAGCEIIFSDGGSRDKSKLLTRIAGYTVVESNRGRASQMNAGAAVSTGDVLLFLHADTRLPNGAAEQVRKAVMGSKHQWGHFDVRIRGRHFMLKVIGFMMNWRSRLSGIATGDQALFIRRDAFERLQGYPNQPLMEDVEMCRQLKKLSEPVCIRDCVMTSGRRWETRGIWKTILLMWYLRFRYWAGADSHDLARLYQ